MQRHRVAALALKPRVRKNRLGALVPLCLALGASAAAGQTHQTRVTSPVQHFGHEIGADSVVMSYTQFMTYWERLARESDRMVLDTIGHTSEGRPQLMAIVTSPTNHRRLERYRDIARRLAQAEELSDAEALQLSAEGKAVVLIAGGLHSVELLTAQQLLETVYRLVSRDDAETRRILDDVIVLAVHANPDGMDLVADWVRQHPLGEDGRVWGLPRLYQKYTGHDNNRDFYASTQAETKNLNRVLYTEWYPQIVYDHHQGTRAIVMAAPPFEDPINLHLDPLIPVSLDLVGAAMHDRFLREGKPGVARMPLSMWHNGMLSTTPRFHNMIGILTETFGSPIPRWIETEPWRQSPRSELPAPVDPQLWRFRQSVEYSVSANYAVLDLASRQRDALLYNIYRMGRNAIERGSRDSWTRYPRHVAAAEQAVGVRLSIKSVR